ncbi:MAG: NAD-dependent epimerase/dehydratase family protein [Ilumatobacteraceae bacterium]
MAEAWAPPHTTLVTGATGWLGQALVRRLVDDDTRPAVWLNVHTQADVALVPEHPKVQRVHVGDLATPGVAAAFVHDAGPDADLVHTAGVIHPAKVAELFRANTEGTTNVVTAARAAGIRRVVHVSSNSPFGTNPHPNDRFRADEPYHPYLGYGRSKMEAELAVLAAVQLGLDATIVRPPWFYGPYQPPRQTTFFKMVRAGRFPLIGGGRQQRSMVYVDNLVDGLIAAELAPHARGKGYWIADARPYEVGEIVETVQRALTDEGLDVKSGAMRLPALAGRVAETADRLIQRAGRYQQQLHVLGEMGHTIACDISASRRELGYEPEVELYEGMRTSIRWCLDQGMSL